MKVANVERTVIDVPFTPRQNQITFESVSPVYNWSVFELCKVTTDTGACRMGRDSYSLHLWSRHRRECRACPRRKPCQIDE